MTDKPKKTGKEATQFKKGNPGGPGRPPLPFDLKVSLQKVRDLRGIANEEIQSAVEEYRKLSPAELKKLSSDMTLPVYKLLIVRAFMKETNAANFAAVASMKNIAVGQEPKQVELSGPNGEPLHPLSSKTPEELTRAWDELQTQIKERECKSTPKPPLELESSVPLPPASSGTAS